MKINWAKFTDPMVTNGVALMREIVSIGYEAYIVGGTVRDIAMGDTDIHDIDIATNMPISEIKNHWRTIEYGGGEKHGTVIVRFRNFDYELTQFRTEGTYSDGRHPDSVEFVKDFKEDTKRRDFTINAMGIDSEGNVIDHHGGLADIDSKTLRTVGSATERFTEDVLRILRAVRFAARFSFNVSDEIVDAIKELKGTVTSTSAERIWSEISKTMSYGGKKFAGALKFMDDTGLMGVVCPEIKLNAGKIKAIAKADSKDEIVNMGILTFELSADVIKEIKERLKLDNNLVAGMLYVAKNLAVYRRLAHIERDKALEIIRNHYFYQLRMIIKAFDFDLPNMEEFLSSIEKLRPVVELMPQVSELISESGVAPSRQFGELKKAVMNALYRIFEEVGTVPDDELIKRTVEKLKG